MTEIQEMACRAIAFDIVRLIGDVFVFCSAIMYWMRNRKMLSALADEPEYTCCACGGDFRSEFEIVYLQGGYIACVPCSEKYGNLAIEDERGQR